MFAVVDTSVIFSVLRYTTRSENMRHIERPTTSAPRLVTYFGSDLTGTAVTVWHSPPGLDSGSQRMVGAVRPYFTDAG
jgi:hypothetical protein